MLRQCEMWESQTTCRGEWDVRPTSYQPGESMRAKELIPILAEIYNFPFETAFMIDRSLAENGLRAKGRGKSIPQMTRREAVIFLVACMVNHRTTRGADDVTPWLSADGYVADNISGVTYADEAAALGLQVEDLEMEEPETELLAFNPAIHEVLTHLGYGKDRQPDDINLIDFLEAACDYLERNPMHSYGFRLEISLSHRWATLTWPGLNDRVSRVEFVTGDNDRVFDRENQISRSASIEGGALLAIAVRTASREGSDADPS